MNYAPSLSNVKFEVEPQFQPEVKSVGKPEVKLEGEPEVELEVNI